MAVESVIDATKLFGEFCALGMPEEKENEYILPILEFCLKEMQKHVLTRNELYEVDPLYKKASRLPDYRKTHPEKAIANINTHMNAQTEEFKQYYNLFSVYAGYLHVDEKEGLSLKDIIRDTTRTKAKEVKQSYGEYVASYSNPDLEERVYETYISWKVMKEMLGKANENNMKKLLFGLLREDMNIAFFLTIERTEDGCPLMDEQVRQYIGVKKLLVQEFPEFSGVGKVLSENDYKTIQKRYNETHTEKRKIATIVGLKTLMSCTATIMQEKSNAEFRAVSDRDFDEVQIQGDGSSVYAVPMTDRSQRVISKLVKELTEKGFAHLAEHEKFVYIRKLVLAQGFGYSEKMAEKVAIQEMKQKYKGTSVNFDRLREKAFGTKSPFLAWVKEKMVSNELPELPDIDKNELLKTVTKNAMYGDIEQIAESCGFDYEAMYVNEGDIEYEYA